MAALEVEMEHVLIQAGAPFMLLLMLLIAYPFKRYVQKMKDCKLKRFLLISW
jgi:hypothetical protein